MGLDYLVVGLGNPGREYKWTRHNIGADFLRYFAEEMGIEFKKDSQINAELAFVEHKGKLLAFLLPDEYMNNSGLAVKKFLDNFDLPSNRILLLYDELNIDFPNFKFSFGKSDGGHKGVLSVINQIKSRDFYRLRIGIGPQKGSDRAAFVLKKFNFLERVKITALFEQLEKASFAFLEKGPEFAMNKYNKK